MRRLGLPLIYTHLVGFVSVCCRLLICTRMASLLYTRYIFAGGGEFLFFATFSGVDRRDALSVRVASRPVLYRSVRPQKCSTKAVTTIYLRLRNSASTTHASSPTVSNSPGARDEHRCTPGSFDEPVQEQSDAQSDNAAAAAASVPAKPRQ